ncbi:MAG: PAS domain S-box protein [Chloroflexota bacterium]
MRKTYLLVMAISIMLGLADWAVDAWFDYLTYYQDNSSFLDAAVLDMPLTELRSRLVEFSLFIILGLVTCRLLAERKRTLDEITKARDELEMRIAQRTEDLANANERLSVELTRRKLVEEALSAENDFRKAMESSMNAGVAVVDLQRRLTYVNRAFCTMVGWSEEELLGAVPPHPFWPAECVAEIVEALGRDLKTQEGSGTEMQFCRKDGERFDVLVLSSHLRDADGKQIGLLGVFYDITERKRAERAREESEMRYRALVEDMPEMMCRFLPDGMLTFVNTSYCTYFGMEKEALIGQNFFQFIPEAERAKVRDHYLSLTPERPSVTYEHKVFAPLGRTRWQEWTDHALFDSAGALVEFQSIGRDVTERRETIRSLRESEERFRVALHNSPVIVFNQDSDLRYTWLHNPRKGFRPDDVIGRTDAELFSREEAGKLTEIKRRVLREGIPAREMVTITVQGETRYYDLTVEPLRDALGSVIGITCAASDMSRHKEDMEVLRESELRLRRLSFELMTSHENERKRLSSELHDELAQALTLIKFRVRRAKDGLQEQHEAERDECELALQYINHVIRGVRHLSEELSPPIIDDLGLTAALRGVVDNFQKRSGLNVTSSVMNIDHFFPRPSQIVFYRILYECLSNIERHAHARNVSVLVSSYGDRVTMYVTDDGRGFDLPRAKLVMSDASGLALMDERAKILGGVLSISSEVGKGTQVALTVPVAPTLAAPAD